MLAWSQTTSKAGKNQALVDWNLLNQLTEYHWTGKNFTHAQKNNIEFRDN